MLREGSAETEPLPANPKMATVAAVNTKFRMDGVFIVMNRNVRLKGVRSYGVYTP